MPPREQRRARRPRLRRGEAIAAVSAIALFVLLFFPWYDVKLTGSQLALPNTSGAERTGWETLGLVAPVLVVAIAAAIGATVLRLLGSGWKPAISPGAAVAVLGGVAALLVLLRILVPPDIGGLGGVEFEPTPNLGAFLGLAAAFGIAAGGYRAMGEEGTSFAGVAARLAKPSR